MTDYSELVKALRCCAENFGCPIECPRYSPADEGVRACVSRLEKDAAAAIEALQAQLPKRGEWIYSKERMRPDMCSICGCVYEADRFMDKIAWNYCPNCGAKMEVQIIKSVTMREGDTDTDGFFRKAVEAVTEVQE